MKKLLYIICIIGALASLQSCDQIGSRFRSTNNQEQEQQEKDTAQSSTGEQNWSVDSASAAKLQSQIQQKDSVIRALSDSLDVVKYNFSSIQQNVKTLEKGQDKLNSSKVSMKMLFVCLALFTILFAILVVVLVRKLVEKYTLTDNDIKGIIEDMARRHPEIVCAGVYPTLNQHTSCINNHAQQINGLTSRVNELATKMNGTSCNVGGNHQPNTQTSIANKTVRESNVFYMMRPLKDMEFEMSLKCLTANEDTFYRFEIDTRHPDKATFTFFNDSPARIRWAVNTKEKTIDRVCYASGDGANGRYKCTSAGEARLQDGKWVVTRKAVVFFD